MKPLKLLIILLLLLWRTVAYAQAVEDAEAFANRVVVDESSKVYRLGSQLAFYEDTSKILTIADVSQPHFESHFQSSNDAIPSFGHSTTPYWVKLVIENRSVSSHIWLLELAYPPAQRIDVYIQRQNGQWQHMDGGMAKSGTSPKFSHRNHIFELDLTQNEVMTVYLRQGGENSKMFPLNLWRADKFAEMVSLEYAILGVYFGIMLAMALYNAFIFFTVRESSYAWYVLFLISYSTFVLVFQGIGAQFFWRSQVAWASPASGLLAILFGQLFTMSFIQTKKLSLKIHRSLRVLNIWLVFVIACTIFGNYYASVILALVTVIFAGCYLISVGAYAVIKGNKPARYYLIAWVALLISIVVVGFRGLGFLPTNLLTEYSYLVGSALETILLSLALAARLNTLKEEKEAAQTEINRQLERYSQDLENTVMERTAALVSAQKKLIIQEKINLLGVLSAGVSHEINTPNNVVNSSLHILKEELLELQKYIYSLLAESEDEGKAQAQQEIENAFKHYFDEIDEQLNLTIVGSQKINEIVMALRVVTRLNDDEHITMDVTDGIANTIKLIPPGLKDDIEFVMDIVDPVVIDCCAAELNQAFLNLIINACQALHLEQRRDGRVCIRSIKTSEHFIVTVEDNGPGMSADVLEKAFDPFFTTREVGDGSGLGLTSTRDIVHKHGGDVELHSVTGEGTRVTVYLPVDPL